MNRANNVLADIQIEFADVLNRHFTDLWQRYIESDLSPEKTVANFLQDQSNVVIVGLSVTTAIFRKIEDLLLEINQFWNSRRDEVRRVIFESDRLSILIGDIDAVSDKYSESVLQLGIYFDTIYLVEPISVAAQRVRQYPDLLKGEEFTRTTIRVLTAYLRVRELLVKVPPQPDCLISAFVPLVGLDWGDTVFNRIFEAATEHTNRLLSDTLQEDIRRPSDILELLRKMPPPTFISKLETDPIVSSLFTGFKNYREYIKAHDSRSLIDSSPFAKYSDAPCLDLTFIYPHIQAAMLSLESGETLAACLGTDTSMRPENHQFNLYRVTRNKESGQKIGLSECEIVAHAITGGKLRWLLPESLSQLRFFRQTETLEELREIFRVNRHLLQKADPADRQIAAEEMVNSVENAVQEALRRLEENRSKGATKLGLHIVQVAGSIGLGILTTVFNLPLAVSIPISALVSTKTIWDIAEKGTLERENELLRQPAFILLNFAKQNELNRVLPLGLDGRLPPGLPFH